MVSKLFIFVVFISFLEKSCLEALKLELFLPHFYPKKRSKNHIRIRLVILLIVRLIKFLGQPHYLKLILCLQISLQVHDFPFTGVVHRIVRGFAFKGVELGLLIPNQQMFVLIYFVFYLVFICNYFFRITKFSRKILSKLHYKNQIFTSLISSFSYIFV